MYYRITAALLFIAVSCTAAETVTNTAPGNARVIVTATRRIDSTDTIPGNPQIITAGNIEEGHYTSIPDALQKEAGIFFRNYTDNPSQAAVDMRGFGDNSHGRVLVLLDGQRLNEADMAGMNWSAVPVHAIERIEVISGPAAALYGDNAVGGVINIITRESSENPTLTLSTAAGSYEAFTQNITASGGITNALNYVVSAEHQSGDGYRDRSRYDNNSIYASLSLTPSDYFTERATFSAVNRQYQLPGALSTAQMKADRQQSDEISDIRDTQYTTRIGAAFIPNEYNRFALDAGYRRMDQVANLNREWGAWGSYYDATKDTWSAAPQYTLTLPIGDAVNELTLGADLRNETILIDRFASDKHAAQSADAKVEQQTMDGYINNRLFLMDDRLILDAGARSGERRIKVHDIVSGNTIYRETKIRHENAYSFAITARPADSVKLYAKYDHFYRFPFTDEQANYFGSVWVDSFTNIEPETGDNAEAGISFDPNEEFGISLTAYHMQMDNEIRYNPTLFANQNLKDTLHEGVDLTASYTPNDVLDFNVIYNYTKAEFDDGPNKGNRIPWVPENRLRASVGIHPTKSLKLTAGATYTGKMYAINDNWNHGSTHKNFTLFDLMLSYSSSNDKMEWSLFAGIDNLLGEEYDLWQVSNAAGTAINHYPAPERTYKAGLSITF